MSHFLENFFKILFKDSDMNLFFPYSVVYQRQFEYKPNILLNTLFAIRILYLQLLQLLHYLSTRPL